MGTRPPSPPHPLDAPSFFPSPPPSQNSPPPTASFGARFAKLRVAASHVSDRVSSAASAAASNASAAVAVARADFVARRALAAEQAAQEAAAAAAAAAEAASFGASEQPGSHHPPPPPPAHCDPAAHAAAFRAALAGPTVDLSALRALCLAGGVPEDIPGLRSTVWQLLLRVLPLERAAWPAARAAQAEAYRRLVRELVVDPHGGSPPPEDHPLSTDPRASVWAAHFQHAEMRDQIGRDVERTQRDMHWFSGGGSGARRAAMARCLFVYAATNATVRYVQGMNELLAPLFYLASTSGAAAYEAREAAPAEPPAVEAADASGEPGSVGWTESSPAVTPAEAAAFATFVPLLAELRDLFCASLDGSVGGVAGAMAALTALVGLRDPELGAHLERLGVNPQFYAFRWITTALTQEFPMPDALRAWDALVADAAGARDALVRTAAAMVLLQRAPLLAGDFAHNVKLLQAFPPTDMHDILRLAAALPRESEMGRAEEAEARAPLGAGLRPVAAWAVRRGLRERAAHPSVTS